MTLSERPLRKGEVMGHSETVINQVRAWKDPAYRATLPEAERAFLGSPIPSVDLMDPSIGRINGGRRDTPISWCLGPPHCHI